MAAPLDRELTDLPPAQRWREWMARVEAVLFAAATPVDRSILARVVGRDCEIELLIDDISAELADRPYEIARVAGGWQFRSRSRLAPAIRAAREREPGSEGRELTSGELLILSIVAYLQPVTRAEIARLTGREVSRDLIARLHRLELIARGPRSPEPGAPYTYVTTQAFLLHFDLQTLRDLPELDALEDAGLLEHRPPGPADLPIAGEATE